MHADVQKYFDTLEALADARADARHKRDTALAAARREYDITYDALAPMHAEEVLQQSSDPLIAWIAKVPMRNFPDYSVEILKQLPATREELDAYAAAHGWCGDWERYLGRAELAGVLPPAQSQTTKASKELYQHVATNWGGETARKLRAMVAAAVTAEIEAAVTAAESSE